MKNLMLYSVFIGLVLTTAIVHAGPTYGFTAVTSNSVIDTGIGEAQMSLMVDAFGSDQVLFTFFNSGPAASSITDVYLEDGILALASIQNGAGVSFSQDAAPSNLPGGSPIGFLATLSADSDAGPGGVMVNGVNPGEQVGLVFNLLGGSTFTDVIDRLNAGIGTTSNIVGDIRVGIHVQGFADGESESFVLGPPPLCRFRERWLLEVSESYS